MTKRKSKTESKPMKSAAPPPSKGQRLTRGELKQMLADAVRTTAKMSRTKP